MSAGPDRCKVGPFSIDLAGCQISGPTGTHKLELLTAQVLECLLRHAGEVVSLNQIVDEVWRGGVAADNAVHKRIAQLRKVLDDDPRAPHFIETVSRRGYRWLPAVSVDSSAEAQPAQARHPVASSKPRLSDRLRLSYAAAAVVLIAAVAALITSRSDNASSALTSLPAERPVRTLLVLPPALRGEGDPVLQELLIESFREILVEDPGINVLSRQTALGMGVEPASLRESVTSYGVELLVQPSIVSTEGSVRLFSVVATDVSSGFEVWTDRVEFSANDSYQSRVEGALRAARSLRSSLVGGETLDDGAPTFASPDHYRDYAMAQYQLGRRTPASLQQAIKSFRGLLQAHPDSYPVLLGLARALVAYAERHPERQSELLEEAEFLAERGLAQRPGSASLKALLGWVRYARGQRQAGLAELSAAVVSNPDLPWAQEQLARALVAANRPQDAEAALGLALTVQPLDVNLTLKLAELKANLGDRRASLALLEDAARFPGSDYEIALMKAQIDYQYGHFDRAAGEVQTAAESATEDDRPAARLALSLAALGQFDQARHWLLIAAERSPQSPFVRSTAFYLAYFSGNLKAASEFMVDPDALPGRTLSLDQRVGIGLFGLREVVLRRWQSAELAFRRLDLLADQRAVTQAGDLFFLGSWLLAAENSGVPDLQQQRTAMVQATQDMLDAGWELPAIHYYAARLFAIAGDAERANQHLRQAQRRGWSHYQAMIADPARERMLALPDYLTLENHAQARVYAQSRQLLAR